MSQTPDPTGSTWGEPATPPGWGSPETTWTSPGQVSEPTDDPTEPTPGEAPTAPPPQTGLPAYGPAPAAGWQPPAFQPGIIPLRPLGLGEILDGAMKAVRFNPKVMFGLSAGVVLVSAVVSTLVGQYLSGFILDTDWYQNYITTGGADDPLSNETVASSLVGTYGLSLVLLLVTPVLTGLLNVAVSKAVIGQRVTISQIVHNRRVWAVLGFTLLMFLVQLVAVGGLGLGAVRLAGSGDGVGIAVATLLLLGFGLLVIVVGGLWLTTRTLLVTPALMLEGGQFWATVRRAWRLTRGSFWRLLGIYVLVYIMLQVIANVILIPGQVVVFVLAFAQVGWSALLVNTLSLTLAYTVTITFQATVTALLYIDVRMRREGLDLELARAAGSA
jgi:hypothetical protein